MDERPCRISDVGGFNQTSMAVDKIEANDESGLLACHCGNVCLKMVMCFLTNS